MRNTPKGLNEELNRMKKLMNFDISENSHDVLSENFVKNANRIDEQTFQKTGPGNTHASGGRSGITKKEWKKQQEEEKNEVAEGSPDELKKLFIEKFASDLGKSKSFKDLPSTLKEDMMGAWLSEGGLPKDFWVNADTYKFQISPHLPKGVSAQVRMGLSGKEGVTFGKSLVTTYQQYDKENFDAYNGKSTNYKFIKTKTGGTTPLIKNNNPVGGTVTLEGFQMLVIAPGIGTGDDAKAMKSTTTPGGASSLKLRSPNIPLNFQTGSDQISSDDRQTILDSLNTFLQSNPKIQKARRDGYEISISDVLVTSSASNSWGGNTLPFTNNNDGAAAGGDYDTSIQFAQDNLNLSNRRGNNLEGILQSDEFRTSLGITPETNIESQGIVTDTSGFVDDDTNRPSNLNRGQFANFTFNVTIRSENPPKIGTSVVLKNFKVLIAKKAGSAGYGSRFDIHFSKAKYLKGGGKGFKSSAAISKNVGKSFRGFGGFLDSILP